MGKYINLIEKESQLILELTEKGGKKIKILCAEDISDYHILEELLSEYLENDWTFTTGDKINQLSEAPVLYKGKLNDDGEVENGFYYYDRYMIDDLALALKNNSELIFLKA